MYISHLRLTNWKNFSDVDADFSRRLFLIGPNASGKSNLLDALRFLRDIANHGLSEAVALRGGVSRLRCLAARQRTTIGVQVQLSTRAGKRWDYSLEITQGNDRRPRIREEVVRDCILEKTVLSRPSDSDREDPLLLTQTSLEQISANRSFREVADFFKSISYQHVVPQAVRDPQSFTPAPVRDDPFGRDLLRRIWETPVKTRTAWLKRIGDVLSKAVPQLRRLDIEMSKQGVPHLVGRYEHWRQHDARQDEAQFSDGTLRLFGLMWSLFVGGGPLLLEEPELSLHPEVVRQLPGLFASLQEAIRRMRRKGDFSQRQVIVSTHSSELLSDTGIGANEILRLEPSPRGTQLMGPDSTDIALIEAGLPVGEVLLPKAAPTKQLVLDFGA